MSVATKMTAIADKIRNLLGLSEKMGLDAIETNLGEVVTEVDSQADLIAQIASALEGKAVEGSGSGIKLPTLSNKGTASDLLSGKQLIDDEGNVVTGTMKNITLSEPHISISDTGQISAAVIPSMTGGYLEANSSAQSRMQLNTQAAKTITPTESEQTAVGKNVYTTGVVTVGAIPSTHENVATETTAYTTELSELGVQIAALENVLEGKAAGGGDASTAYWISLSSLPTTYGYGGDMDYATYYLEWSDDILTYLVSTNKNRDIYQIFYRGDTASHTYYNVMTHHDTIGLLHINDNTAVDYGPGYDIVAIRAPIGTDYYLLPVYQTDNSQRR